MDREIGYDETEVQRRVQDRGGKAGTRDGASRSGFHAWLGSPISECAAHDAKLVQATDKSFKASDRACGARPVWRVWRDALKDGLAFGLHRIERVMRPNAMRAQPKRRVNPKKDGERPVIADTILDRDFVADVSNQEWLADVTCSWTAEGFP